MKRLTRWRSVARLRTGASVLATATAASCASLGASPSGDRLARIEASPNYRKGEFQNRLRVSTADYGLMEFLDILQDFLKFDPNREPRSVPGVQQADVANLVAAPSDDFEVVWFGHSTLLIEIEGLRILTDPVWSDRSSPFQFVGPKRFYEPLVELVDLPPLDAILISHDHYDHLDADTIRQLASLDVQFYVPLGVGAHLESWGVRPAKIIEMDWWQEQSLGQVRIACTPTRHFSGRGVADRNKTLWASWALVGQQRRIYFGGDSGLFPGFSEIGDRYGPFDVTFLEVGAYNQRWPDVHMGPEQAAIAHRALKGNVLFPIHWGLFNLSLHSWTEPAERLQVIADTQDVRIAFPIPGRPVNLDDPIPVARWWPEVPWQTAEQNPVRSTRIPPDWLQRYSAAPAKSLPTVGVR